MWISLAGSTTCLGRNCERKNFKKEDKRTITQAICVNKILVFLSKSYPLAH